MYKKPLVLCFCIVLHLYGIAQPSSSQFIVHPIVLDATVRIDDGKGTATIVSKRLGDGKKSYYLVLCKHQIGRWNPKEFYPDSSIQIMIYTGDSIRPTLPYPIQILNIDGLNSNVLLHPNPKVDLAVIKIDDCSRFVDSDKTPTKSFPVECMVPFDEITSATSCNVGSEVLVIGFPNGKYSKETGRPIIKSVSIASEIRRLNTYPWNFNDTAGTRRRTESAPMVILVDGKLVGGNSGGPVILRYESCDSPNQHDLSLPDYRFNRIIGFVSSGDDDGLTFIFSTDYVLELINKT